MTLAISRAFLFDGPTGNFVDARYADLTLAPISLREAVAARKALNAQAKREVDSRAVVRTAIAQRELVARATKTTALIRRSVGSQRSVVDDEDRCSAEDA